MQRALSSLAIIVALSIATLWAGLGRLPLTGADEPRYARIAEEMRLSGRWVTPTLEGRPWLEKPPLYYWITRVPGSLCGSAETAARIGPALCAFLAALAVLWAGTRIWSPLAGVLGATILVTSLGFAGFGRSASTDMPFTCFFTLSLAVLAVAVERDIGWKVLAAWVFLGLAVLAKGPVALLLAGGTALLCWYLNERGGMLRRWRTGPGVAVALAVSVPWFWLAFRENGYAFIATFFINHNFARYVTDIHHHAQPLYYYLPVLLALFFPWSGWLVALAGKSPLAELRRWREWRPAPLFTLCWFLFPILFFSLSGSKLAGYILPSLPPLALLLGARLARWIGEGAEARALCAAVTAQALLALGLAVAAPVFFQKDYGGHWREGLAISLAVLVPAGFALHYGWSGRPRDAVRATALGGAALVLAVVLFAFPVLGEYHSTRTIAREALALRRGEEPILTYRFFHHTLHYYTGYRVEGEPKEIGALRRAVAGRAAALVVTKDDGVREIGDAGDFDTVPLARQGDFRLVRILPKR
ncbi:MAG: glycosyltransferase family 39 protein [Acidobacteria bacterium]|nr:glycosyltransferase family 39 protein [Acidobacteriota bacterium]